MTPAGATAASVRRGRRFPTLRHERQLWRVNQGLLVAVDEVGRGALAGPVSVGAVLLSADTKPAPVGVTDSKLLTPHAREALAPKIKKWALDSAVGHATAAEIDAHGLMAALRTAAERAIGQLRIPPDWVLLDGNHDYITRRPHGAGSSILGGDGLFELPTPRAEPPPETGWRCSVPVITIIKGDLKCASIAAASVLAKTERDAMLVELATQHPEYGFEENKAYSTPFHLEALGTHGPCEAHRRTWNLPLGARAELSSMAAEELMGDDEQMTVVGVGA